MEAPLAIHKCVRQSLVRFARCGRAVNTKSNPRSRLQVTQTSARPFSSASRKHLDAPPQPQPVSQEKNAQDAVGAIPTRTQRQSVSEPDPNTRIDLSSLPGIPSSYVPPGGRSQQRPGSASAKLNAMFGETQRSTENPYQKAIRQTNALNRTSPSSSTVPYDNPQPFDLTKLFDDIALTNRPAGASAEVKKLPLRLKPTLGRSQSLNEGRGIDLTRAFRMLEIKCAANSVRKDMIKQKFHVRRGQRRKLDRSLRWRTAFKAGFLEECARIRRMKNQGW